MTRRSLAGVFALVALASAGCGGSEPSANDVLAETAAKLGEIRSGDLSLRLVVSAEEKDVGFELKGPFALAENGALPVAEVEYTQIAGSRSATATFLSTGEEAFVRVDGNTFELPAAEVERLRASGGGSGEGLGELRIDDWIGDPKLETGGEVGGAETDRLTATLDPVAVANDLLALAAELGGGRATRLEGADAEQLRRAVESSRIEVNTGRDDRILRRLVLEADLRANVPEELKSALPALPSAHFEFRLEIANPNKRVEVEAPANARPFRGG